MEDDQIRKTLKPKPQTTLISYGGGGETLAQLLRTQQSEHKENTSF